DLLTILDGDDGADLESDRHRMLGARDTHFLTLIVDQFDLRTRSLAGRTGSTTLGVADNQRRQTRNLVDLLGDGDALFHVLELHRTGVLRDDRAGVRIPRRQLRTSLDGHAVVDEQSCAIRQLVTLALTVHVVGNDQFGRTRDDNLLALGVGDVAHIAGETDGTRRLRFHAACHGCTRSRATDVERTHGELRTRLADRLG